MLWTVNTENHVFIFNSSVKPFFTEWCYLYFGELSYYSSQQSATPTNFFCRLQSNVFDAASLFQCTT